MLRVIRRGLAVDAATVAADATGTPSLACLIATDAAEHVYGSEPVVGAMSDRDLPALPKASPSALLLTSRPTTAAELQRKEDDDGRS